MDVLGTLPGEDAFGDALRRLRIDGAVFCRPVCSDPWGITIRRDDLAYFHIVTEGRCRLELTENGERADLHAGDVVILPHGDPHRLSDDPSTPAPLQDRTPVKAPDEPYEVVHLGPAGGGRATSLICGGLTLGDGGAAPLLAGLPPLLHLLADEDRTAPWLGRTLRLVEHEVLSPRPGAEGVVNRLSEILFIQALRAYFRRLGPGQGGWIGALKDERIGRAIGLMIRDCRRQWTVPELAAECHMSRSGFASRFERLTGDTPMRFLRRWRLGVATGLLREGAGSTAAVAHRVGYRSTVAFAKAFRRDLGVTPGEYRASRLSRDD